MNASQSQPSPLDNGRPFHQPPVATQHTGRVPFVDLTAQHAATQPEVIEAITAVLSDADFILGRAVQLFEEEFARFCGVRHGIGADSGTSALELALRAYGIGPGHEVITVANTFVATALAISYTGATPVLVDVDPATHLMDVEQVKRRITNRTRAIVPVHLYGHPADMDPIMELAERRRLIVIEDACQAHGARYKGRRVGSLGHVAAFSFYPSKNLGGCGDGGMVVTDDAHVAEAVRLLRNYGQREKYQHVVRGYNRRLDTLQAAVLRVKLGRLDEWNQARCNHAERYRLLLNGSGVALPKVASWAEPVWHLYVIQTPHRDTLKARLTRDNVDTGIHYPVPIHLQTAYRDLGHRLGDFPVAERLAGRILSLPMYPELPEPAIEKVAAAVRGFAPSESHQVEVA